MAHDEVRVRKETIHQIFTELQDRVYDGAILAKGAGCLKKLEPNNYGLIAGSLALNAGASPALATQVCNIVERWHPFCQSGSL